MKTLISPAEVPALVFGTSTTLRAEDIPLQTILAAERRYLQPVVGKTLYEELTAPSPSQTLTLFTEEYLKMPLALYVVSLLLPTIATQVGAAGVVRISGGSFEAVNERTLQRLRRRLRTDADTLLDRATSHLAANPNLFPSYNPQENIRERISVKGGVVL